MNDVIRFANVCRRLFCDRRKSNNYMYPQYDRNCIYQHITSIAATHNVKLAYLTDRVIHLREGNIEKDEQVLDGGSR